LSDETRPIVLVTGALGAIGSALTSALKDRYRVVGLDRDESDVADFIQGDLTCDDSMTLAFRRLRDGYGDRIAAVIHLAAYFDFTGEDSPLYGAVNVAGTRLLLHGLRDFSVGRFIYSGTMLVHQPCEPGQRITEDTPLAPKWPYPQSKAATEKVIEEEAGDIPYLLLHLAGLYDDGTAVPTLSHQIARIYERSLKSRHYTGDLHVGQSFVHVDDMIDAFVRAVDRRDELPPRATLLIGEPDAMGYGALQNEIGRLLHDSERWTTFTVPKSVARAAAWVEEKSEPVVPDVIDQGEKPFIRPFMVDMADDHYALDISRARDLLGWEPRHWIGDELPRLAQSLKDDPMGWYARNGITPPRWLQAAARKVKNPEELRSRHEARYRERHSQFLWAHFVTMGLSVWLVTSPPLLGYASPGLAASDVVSGCIIFLCAFVSLSPRYGMVRWATAAVGFWLLFAPLVFATPSAAAYLNDTLVGGLVIGFAVLARPPPGVSAVAAMTGPTIPPGWEFSPSSWFQRAPIIILAVVGLLISRYLTAYQLAHIEGVWEPFFEGGPSPKNGTEEIITSWVSEAWPVSDAGVGAIAYMLEILTGLLGSARRWRTMPWLVVLFGILIVPLGVVSITFIVIQPILLGTWCTLCLIAAAAMVIQIPYSLDELVATGQFLNRRRKAGANLIRIFFAGDTDDGREEEVQDFARPPRVIVRDMLGGGVSVPWNLGVCIAIGVWLMFTRLTLGTEGGMANADHLIGSLVITVTVMTLAEVARPVRFLNIVFGLALLITPFAYGVGWPATISSLVCGVGLIALSLRRGSVSYRYGSWNKFIV
jgi:nucleoside-diphosphate-sugar epimerase/uncharacterized membrane protein